MLESSSKISEEEEEEEAGAGAGAGAVQGESEQEGKFVGAVGPFNCLAAAS